MLYPFEESFFYIAVAPTEGDLAQIQNQLRYDAAEVSSEEFSRHYTGDGWMGRKVVALPMALWTGVVMTTVHLASALFYSLMFWDRGKFASAYFFAARRDIQEGLGRLTTIFDDKSGLHSIQEAEFHKAAYSAYRIMHWGSPIDHEWSVDEVNRYLQKTAIYQMRGIFECLSEEHWRGLAITRLSKEKIKALRLYPAGGMPSIEERRAAFALIPVQEVLHAFEMKLMDMTTTEWNRVLSEEQLDAIRHSEHLQPWDINLIVNGVQVFPNFEEMFRQAQDFFARFMDSGIGLDNKDQRRDRLCDALGSPRTSTDEEIRRAYRQFARRNHPDKTAHLPPDQRAAAEERFKAVSAALQAYEDVR